MELYKILLAKNNISKTIGKINYSLHDIKQNNAHRSDLIQSMEQSIDDLNESLLGFIYLEKELRSSRQLTTSLSLNNMKMYQELQNNKEKQVDFDTEKYIQNLEIENAELKNKLDILIKQL
jgi:hypothetical protein